MAHRLQPETIDTGSVQIVEPGNPPKTIQKIIIELISAANTASTEPNLMRREFAPGTVAKNLFGRTEAKVAALQFMLRFDSAEQKAVVKGEDHVAMIMRSIFDSRRFVISPTGTIRESQS